MLIIIKKVEKSNLQQADDLRFLSRSYFWYAILMFSSKSGSYILLIRLDRASRSSVLRLASYSNIKAVSSVYLYNYNIPLSNNPTLLLKKSIVRISCVFVFVVFIYFLAFFFLNAKFNNIDRKIKLE